MKVKLQVQQMWDTVQYGDVDSHEDRQVLEALLATLPMEMARTSWERGLPRLLWMLSLWPELAKTLLAKVLVEVGSFGFQAK